MTRGKSLLHRGDDTPILGDCAPFQGLRGRGADGSTDSLGPRRAPSLINPRRLKECEWKGVSQKSSPQRTRPILGSAKVTGNKIRRFRFFPLAFTSRKSKSGGVQLDRGPPSHGRKGENNVLIDGYIPDVTIRHPRKLHEALSDLTGRSVTKYGDLHTTTRREKPTEAEYLKDLYQYVGRGTLAACPLYGAAFQSKPYRCQE